MSVVQIGPIPIDFHGNPTFQWNSAPNGRGMRAASISGLLDWPEAQQLSELVANDARRITVSGETGVLEVIYSDDTLLSPFSGWYLFQTCSLPPDQSHSIGGNGCPFTLGLMSLGNRQPVVTRSDRARTNSWSVTPKVMVADPFYGNGFVSSPGGTLRTADYDPEPFDMARVATSAATMNRYVASVSTLAEVILCSPGD